MAVRIEEEVFKLLKENKVTITTAESCTGGLIAGTLVNVAGISEFFMEGYVTYSNEAKEKILQVAHETLEVHGAVSQETAREMALGAAKTAESDMSIVSTGIAGPDGGTKDKPVGLVYLACCYKGSVKVEKNIFPGNRSQVRQQSVQRALELVRDTLLENVEKRN